VARLDLGRYAIDYQTAVNVLLDDKSFKHDFTVFPMIYLYRHYIELRLKEIIIYNWQYLNIVEPFPSGHDIYKLWDICRSCLKKTDKLVDPKFTQTAEYVEQIIRAYDSLEADLIKFAEIDSDSQHFRYPVDKHGIPLVIDEQLLSELQSEFPELVERISCDLDGICTGIYTILQDKYEWLAQQENYTDLE